MSSLDYINPSGLDSQCNVTRGWAMAPCGCIWRWQRCTLIPDVVIVWRWCPEVTCRICDVYGSAVSVDVFERDFDSFGGPWA